MKRILISALAFLLVLMSVVGCAKEGGTADVTTSADAQTTAAPPAEEVKTTLDIVVGGKTIGQTWLYVIGVDAGKADIMGALKVQEPGPKYCHFPKGMDRGYDNAFFNGLLSEKLVMKTDRGRTRWAWEKLPGHERNEALDCRNYALAALRVLDPDMDRVEARLRQKVDEKPKEQPAKMRKRSKTNRNVGTVNDW